ncbi:NADP-dependent oxidoreductase [Dactylosporangium sp. NPDC049140]|jgi:NADPH:quinone reductase-like Zn-dependent oxidoreductase|uniref:NADP-dependent oxidoreductase n=1 Tax=Dactylosporangium sp. NPDC049140 TaxID=3155647 RepID=UPI0034115DD8
MVRLSMQAVVARRYGPPEEHAIEEVPAPEPGPGQLQVRIAAVSLNPADVRLPAGDFRDAVDLPFPHIPGNDFAGTVTALGAGVTRFAPGDEIFGFATPRALRHMGSSSLSTGALAEYAVFEADTPFLAHRPDAVGIAQAAALPTVGLTARALLATAAIAPGERVLVVGATGGVGTAVLPLLAAAGAHVVATARPGEADLVRSLGAAGTAGYDEYPSGVDAALNLVLPGDRLGPVAAAVRPGGRLLTITFPPPPAFAGIDVRLVLDMEGRYGGMADVAADAAAGRLRARIDREYAFPDAITALADFARRHKTGKLVVRVRSRA